MINSPDKKLPIRIARLKKGIGMSEAADRCYLDIGTYSRMERGERGVDPVSARLMLHLFPTLTLDGIYEIPSLAEARKLGKKRRA